jgi:hypothetical protein
MHPTPTTARFEALSKPDLMSGEWNSRWIEADADKKTLSIRDNGIGMSRDEAVRTSDHRAPAPRVLPKLSGDQRRLTAHRPVRGGVLFGSSSRAHRGTHAPWVPPPKVCAGIGR